ncbi:STAS domain-containing protein [Uliginosibacterium sp. H3]|uniref:STAS domain-containing protein n=1 Tax=Uliginosibacterium silvisoli TaxID=3114758 RepID=A0ABU6K391_9RHOO|nr:STAS domain-containing protein [Uliginosibacterium sp. H3]
MPACAITETTPGQIAVEGDLTIYDAARMKDELLARLHANSKLAVDLSGVTELDTSGVQLLLLLQREAGEANKPLQWGKHSAAVSEVLTLLNLGSTLGEPVSIVWS